MHSCILVVAASLQLNHVGAKDQLNHVIAKDQPRARLPRRLDGYSACCVEHSYWADGEVTGTTCSGGRSPWDASTMSDLCTAGYSEAGEWAPPFRDCSQAAIDADAGCGTADWETCAVCAEYGIPTGMFFANVGYASCPDWVVDAMNAEAENGGQCAEGLGGVRTCPTCDGWCSCEDCAGPVNSCDWDCDESRSNPTWGGSRSDCWGDDDDGSGGGGSSMWVVGMIGGVLGVAVIVAVCVCIYCYVRYLRAKAAAAPPPMVEVQVLGTVAGAVELGPLKGAPHADPVPSAPPAAMMPPPAPPRNFCSACGAPVQGPFCGQCGARA